MADSRRDADSGHSARTITVMMLLTLLGKLLGLYRDRLLAVHYGVGMEANAFYTASRIPRVFFDTVFASAITACFIPVFGEYLSKKGRDAAFRFSGCFITVIAFLCAGFTLLGMALSGPLVSLFAGGYGPETAALAESLTRMLFPTTLCTGLAFSFVGILQSLGEFTIPALISAVSNGVIILYFYTLNEQGGIYGLAGAFLLGWLLQAAVQLPALKRKGFRYYPRLSFRDEGMKKVFALMGPVMVSTWVQPINLTVNSRFGSALYDGAGVSAIELSTNLYLVIAGVLVLSVTNVLFPKLSRLTAGGSQEAFRDTLRGALRGTLFFVFPLSAGLMAVAQPLVECIYGGGAFDAFAVDITSHALVWVSLGMPGYAVQNVLSRAYFARQEGRAPLIAGAVSIGVNLLLCLVLTGPLQVTGLAMASAVSSLVYALLLDIPLEKRGEGLGGMAADLGKMLGAAVLTGMVAWGIRTAAAGLLPGKAGLLLAMGLAAAVGAAVYFLAATILKLPEMRMALNLAKQFLKRG